MDFSTLFQHWWQFLLYAFVLITLVQLFYLWYFFNRLGMHRPAEKDQSQQHPVSVIVCARDEAARLAVNLPGLLVQRYPTTHEVLVINHNSQDETKYLLEEFKKSFKGLQVVNLEQEAKGIPGKKYPLSIGIKEAKHEIVLLTDADCVPASEFWIQKMQDEYREGIDIVLGYGAYHKKPGILNKIIRFDAFHSALQYLSFALAGIPYMGVGRNLSYKKTLFFRNKGFSSINHIPGGDDDLFINKIANGQNTAVATDPDAFTLSDPKRKFGDWIRQKNRHYSTARYYKPLHKFLLFGYSLSSFLYYPLFIMALIWNPLLWVIPVFSVRFFSQAIVYYKSMRRLNEKDLFPWWWLLDIWMFLYYCIFAPSLWKRPAKTWT